MPYVIASFLGAFALFFLQPLLGKALTPRFGGSAGVWMACLVFFQGVLLAGYLGAHALQRLTASRQQRIYRQAWLAVGLSLIAGTALVGTPFLPPHWMPRVTAWPGPWAMLLLALSAGLPLLMLSATSPLLQVWGARARPHREPYRLYAASNLGSFAGLLVYPLLVEPSLPLRVQAWTAGGLFIAYAALMCGCARWAAASPDPGIPETEPPPLSLREWGAWVALAAVGSSLLLGTSSLFSQEFAAIPLIWVLPLGVYLGTFIVAFDGRFELGRPGRVATLLAILGAAALAFPPLLAHHAALALVLDGLLLLGAGALLCHGSLHARRPTPALLTRYYLAIALGGFLGGALVAILAPLMMNRLLEFPFAVAGAMLVGFLWSRRLAGPGLSLGRNLVATLAMAGCTALIVAEMSRAGSFLRDAYGIILVRELPEEHARVLVHGRTVHGILDLRDPLRPLGYHGPDSGSARAFAFLRAQGRPLRIGILGLGAGNALAFVRPGDAVDVFELSPAVLKLAAERDSPFQAVAASPAPVRVVAGDARTCLEADSKTDRPPYDLLLVDAFAGASVPWHLVTREAFQSYLQRLAPGGLLVVNVTNRLPIDQLVAAAARECGLWGVALEDPMPGTPTRLGPLERHSHYVVLCRGAAPFQNALLGAGASWRLVPVGEASGTFRAPTPRRAWTDESNAMAPLLFGW